MTRDLELLAQELATRPGPLDFAVILSIADAIELNDRAVEELEQCKAKAVGA